MPPSKLLPLLVAGFACLCFTVEAAVDVKELPGKVRVEIFGKAEDFIATLVDDGAELPSGTPVLVVAEGERGTLLVSKAVE